jgi:hypothetical protein
MNWPKSSGAGDGGLWSAGVFLSALIYLLLRIADPALLLVNIDQGYQMALGMAVAKGLLPGFDFITQYGPAVSFASFIAFAVTGNAVGELLLSAAGYAAAITIAASIVRRPAGQFASLLTALGLLIWFPRLYKWYYCLFPLIGIAAAQIYHSAREEDRPRTLFLFGWAQIVGLAGLFRYDLGLEGGIFGVLAIFAHHYVIGWSRARVAVQDVIKFAFGSLMLPLTYMVAIFWFRGTDRLAMFIRSIYDGAADTVEYYSNPPFQFDGMDWLSDGNALAFLQIVIPLTYLVGGTIGILSARTGARAGTSDNFTLFCASLTGFGIFPQAMHRADLQHLLQVGYPFIITFVLLAGLFVSKFNKMAWPVRFAGTLGVVCVLVPMFLVIPGTGKDLSPVSDHPMRQWRMVAGLPGSMPSNPVAGMADAIRRLTPAEAKVFFVMTPTDMAMLFFAERHQPGLFPVYESGMFSDPAWLRGNRAALEACPPEYLVVRQTADDETQRDLAPFIPDLLEEWRSRFSVTLFENQRYKLLAPLR